MINPVPQLAVKSNGYQLDNFNKNTPVLHTNQKFSLAIDYLVLTFGGDFDLTYNKLYELKKHDFGTKIFNEIYDIFHKSVKIGTLLRTPKSKILKPDLLQIKFENNLFYTKKSHELLEIFHNFESNFNITFNNINRLDIALDTNNQGNFYQNLLSDLFNKKILLSGREKALNIYHTINKGAINIDGISCGKRSSSRYLRIYDKTKEMLSNEKPYITKYWQNHALNIHNVWRFEYQINSTFFQDYKTSFITEGHNFYERILNFLFTPKGQIQILKFSTKNHFEFKMNTGKSETNKEKSIEIINFDYIESLLPKHSYNVVKVKYKPTVDKTISVKRYIKQTFRNYYLSFQKDLTSIMNLSSFIHYHSTDLIDYQIYINEKIKNWLKDFKKLYNIDFDYEQYNEHLTYSI